MTKNSGEREQPHIHPLALADTAKTGPTETLRQWELLCTMAQTDVDRHVRLAAIKNLEHQPMLAEIAKDHVAYENEVRAAAIGQIANPKLLGEIAIVPSLTI